MKIAQTAVPQRVATQLDTKIGGYPSFSLRSAISMLITTADDQGSSSIMELAKQDTLWIYARLSPAFWHRSITSGTAIRIEEEELPVMAAIKQTDRIKMNPTGTFKLKIPSIIL